VDTTVWITHISAGQSYLALMSARVGLLRLHRAGLIEFAGAERAQRQWSASGAWAGGLARAGAAGGQG